MYIQLLRINHLVFHMGQVTVKILRNMTLQGITVFNYLDSENLLVLQYKK